MIIRAKSGQDRIQVNAFFRGNARAGYQVDEIRFSDGVVLDVDAIKVLVASESNILNAPVDHAVHSVHSMVNAMASFEHSSSDNLLNGHSDELSNNAAALMSSSIN